MKKYPADLHVHSNFSKDAHFSFEEIIRTAKLLGLKDVAITDHSKDFFDEEGFIDLYRLEKYYELTAVLKEKTPDLTIFHGIECDIQKDGSLDLPNEYLQNFEFVIASIHDDFQDDSTKRLLKVINNPFVNLIGHPIGRLIKGHEPIFDHARVIKTAIRNQTALEINLKASGNAIENFCREINQNPGLIYSINSDAHIPKEMLRAGTIGVIIERCKLDIRYLLNAKTPESIRNFVANKRRILDN